MTSVDSTGGILPRLCVLVLVSQLTGCVTAHKFHLSYSPEPEILSALASTTFSVAVTDQRPYVIHGRKTPFYLGLIRTGDGIPRDVVSDKKIPFADQMKGDLSRELESLGLRASSSPSRQLTVRIRDWNFDTGAKCRVTYDVELSVATSSGEPLATSTVKDERVFEGNPFNVIAVIRKEIPVHYAELIRELVRDNPTTLAALQPNR